MQLLFFFQNVTYVDTGADVANKFAPPAITRHTFIAHIPILAVTTTQTVLHGEWLPRIKCADVGCQTLLEIVRMDTFAPAVAQLFFYLSSPKFEPRPIEEGAELIWPGHPH